MRELNCKSSEIVRRALAGERVVVTSRGTPIVEIGPVRSHPEPARREDVGRAFRTIGTVDRHRFRRDLDAVVDQSL